MESYAGVYGAVVTYSYDGNSNVTQRADSLGGVLTSVYDAQDRLTSLRLAGTGVTAVRTDLAYDDRGELTAMTWFSSVAGTGTVAYSAYARDDAGRLTGITNKDGSNATLSYYTYGHDSANRVTTHAYSSQVGTVAYSGTRTYSYDSASQVTGDTGTAYSFDAAGNRTMAGYATVQANQLTNDGVFTYTPDAEGNLSTKSTGTGLETWYYTYDGRDRMTNVRKTSDGSTTTLSVTFAYDAEDRWVEEARWESGVGTAVVRPQWDGDQAWADLDGSSALTTRYVYGKGTDEVLARSTGSATTAYLTDNIGTVRDVVNWSGVVVNHADADAYGNVTESNADAADRVGFAGGDVIEGTGGTRFGARVYASNVGRWTQQDPILFSGGDTNLYLTSPGTRSTSQTLRGSLYRQRHHVLATNDISWATCRFLSTITTTAGVEFLHTGDIGRSGEKGRS